MTSSSAPAATLPVRPGSHGRIAGAATARVRALLAGPQRPARVLHVGRDAVYVAMDGWCLGLLSRAARQVPCGIRTTAPALSGLLGPDVVPGSPALVGEGALILDRLQIRVVRVVDMAVPRLPAATVEAHGSLATALRTPAEPVRGQLTAVRHELPGAALQALTDGGSAATGQQLTDAARGLLGRGSGLTPLGDDVLAGWLATGVALGRTGDPRHLAVATTVAELAPGATTLLSATLLECARAGEVLPEFRRLLLAGDAEGTRRALAQLVAVGHTSGAGLALGCSLALSTPQEGRSA